MVNQMQDCTRFLIILPNSAAIAALDAGTFKSVADLVTFFCVTVISLVLIFWAAPTAKTRLVQSMSVLLCGSGVLHFLAYWHRDQAMHSSSVIVASAIAMLLILVAALVIYLLKKSSSAQHLAQAQQSLSKAQEELSREQYLMSSLVDNMPDSIYFKDAESCFIRCNRRTADVFELADRVAVMKNGQIVGSANTGDVTKDEVLGMIIAGKCPENAIAGPGAIAE